VHNHFLTQQGIRHRAKAKSTKNTWNTQLPLPETGNGQLHDFWHKTGIQRLNDKQRQKHQELWTVAVAVAQSPGFEDQKETFRIILANSQ
jgi:hypothetical protein